MRFSSRRRRVFGGRSFRTQIEPKCHELQELRPRQRRIVEAHDLAQFNRRSLSADRIKVVLPVPGITGDDCDAFARRQPILQGRQRFLVLLRQNRKRGSASGRTDVPADRGTIHTLGLSLLSVYRTNDRRHTRPANMPLTIPNPSLRRSAARAPKVLRIIGIDASGAG